MSRGKSKKAGSLLSYSSTFEKPDSRQTHSAVSEAEGDVSSQSKDEKRNNIKPNFTKESLLFASSDASRNSAILTSCHNFKRGLVGERQRMKKQRMDEHHQGT